MQVNNNKLKGNCFWARACFKSETFRSKKSSSIFYLVLFEYFL